MQGCQLHTSHKCTAVVACDFHACHRDLHRCTSVLSSAADSISVLAVVLRYKLTVRMTNARHGKLIYSVGQVIIDGFD